MKKKDFFFDKQKLRENTSSGSILQEMLKVFQGRREMMYDQMYIKKGRAPEKESMDVK